MVLAAKNVTRQFLRGRGNSNVFDAVKDVSLGLSGKEITVITGPSGSGKSTLLNMMAGILVPTEGTIEIGGKDLYSMDDEKRSAFRNRHIGVIPQGQTAIHSLTVLDNVLLPYTMYERKKKKLRDEEGGEEPDRQVVTGRALELLDKTGIPELADAMPSEISGGEQRRMAITRAVLMRPDVILADEPTADLDEENTEVILSLMRYAADEGSAVCIVTHDKDVFPWADHMFRLQKGRLY